VARRSVIPVSLLVAATALVAGCGGGGNDDATAAPIGRAEFIKQASAICAKDRARLPSEVKAYLRYPSSKRKPAPVLNADIAHSILLPEIEEEIRKIEELGFPPGDKKRIGKMFSKARIAIDKGATTKRMQSRNSFRKYFGEEADGRYRNYGLEACTNGPGSPR
jgi:hypothetical protein